jgi:hypothetical protein
MRRFWRGFVLADVVDVDIVDGLFDVELQEMMMFEAGGFGGAAYEKYRSFWRGLAGVGGFSVGGGLAGGGRADIDS